MKLTKTLDIPNIQINNTRVTKTSNITLSYDSNVYCIDFVHEIPDDEKSLIDVECVAKRIEYDEAKAIAIALANFFCIPFKDTLFADVVTNPIVNFSLTSRSVKNDNGCPCLVYSKSLKVSDEPDFEIVACRTIAAIYPHTSFEVEINTFFGTVYLNFDVKNGVKIEEDLKNFDFWIYNFPLDTLSRLDDDIADYLVYFTEEFRDKLLVAAIEVWNSNPTWDSDDNFNFVDMWIDRGSAIYNDTTNDTSEKDYPQQNDNVNDDVCVWHYSSTRQGLYEPSCNNDEDDFMDWLSIRHFNYCPYCGKKLEVVDED